MENLRFKRFVALNCIKEKTQDGLSYKKASDIFGTKTLTTRQPPSIHAALEMMSENLSGVTKAEIIYESIMLAFKQFEDEMIAINPTLSEVVERLYSYQPQNEHDEPDIEIRKFDSVYNGYLSSIGDFKDISESESNKESAE